MNVAALIEEFEERRIVAGHWCRLASLTPACYAAAMQFSLVRHPATPLSGPDFKVWVNVDHAGSLGVVASTNIWFGIGAPASRFVMPEAEEPGRADELWRTTCLE